MREVVHADPSERFPDPLCAKQIDDIDYIDPRIKDDLQKIEDYYKLKYRIHIEYPPKNKAEIARKFKKVSVDLNEFCINHIRDYSLNVQKHLEGLAKGRTEYATRELTKSEKEQCRKFVSLLADHRNRYLSGMTRKLNEACQRACARVAD